MGDTEYDDFMLKEYEKIVESHFNTQNSISSFFKYYLLLLGAPFYIIGFTIADNANNSVQTFGTIIQILNTYSTPAAVFFFMLALAGLCVMTYLIALRMDALLYARTVNGIRNYFTNKSGLENEYLKNNNLLPMSVNKPKYFEISNFVPILFAISIFNTVYGFVGLYILKRNNDLSVTFNIFKKNFIISADYSFWAIIIIFFISHFLIYLVFTYIRENSYLQSHHIGVDIDGVLNQQREQFCSFLENDCDIKIDPDEINDIPVSDVFDNVTPTDEYRVFHNSKYWTDMPVDKEAPSVLSSLSNSYRYNVYIITSRPWPVKEELYNKKVWASDLRFLIDKSKNINWFKRQYYHLQSHAPWIPKINLITKVWLKKNGIKYKKLIVEKGSEHTTDRRWRTNNRFHIAKKKSLRFFIEDDPYKAYKLSFICDYVFLINHPYNTTIRSHNGEKIQFPRNIIRVDSWKELKKTIKHMV